MQRSKKKRMIQLMPPRTNPTTTLQSRVAKAARSTISSSFARRARHAEKQVDGRRLLAVLKSLQPSCHRASSCLSKHQHIARRLSLALLGRRKRSCHKRRRTHCPTKHLGEHAQIGAHRGVEIRLRLDLQNKAQKVRNDQMRKRTFEPYAFRVSLRECGVRERIKIKLKIKSPT